MSANICTPMTPKIAYTNAISTRSVESPGRLMISASIRMRTPGIMPIERSGRNTRTVRNTLVFIKSPGKNTR
jgi:hypothetical protein